MKVNKEWFYKAPWGNIAFISWGDPKGEPVLLVHGRRDSAATFIPLLELLPKTYHYVGIDLPGHGKSDAFPISVMITRFIQVVAVDYAVRHLGWKQFIYLSHSMGGEIGFFYNAIYPNRFKKCIYLDVGPALYRLQIYDPVYYQRTYYDNYYTNYDEINKDDRVYTKQKALQAVMRARKMTEKQAEIILSRNLKQIGDDKYQLSWDKRLRHPAPFFLTPDHYYKLFTKSSPPTLIISASYQDGVYSEGKVIVDTMLKDMEKNLKHFYMKSVEGGHDVHFTHPERVAGHVVKFLQTDFKAKL